MQKSNSLRVGGKFDLIKKLGAGSFGDIYLAKDIKTGESRAIKMEPARSKYPQLFYENKLYQAFKGGAGISAVYWYGLEGDYNCMVIDILG